MADHFWTARPASHWMMSFSSASAGTGARAPQDGEGAFARKSRAASSSTFVEVLGVAAAQVHREAWRALIDNAVEKNVFLEPSFAVSAAQHFAEADRPSFVFVWRRGANTPRERLIAVWPLTLPRTLFGGVGRLWMHKQACLGAPLIDRDFAAEAVDDFFAFTARAFPHLRALAIPQLPRAGATLALLRTRANLRDRAFVILGSIERAALPKMPPLTRAYDLIPAKKRKELRRQWRRLEDLGALDFVETREGPALREAAERFLALEMSGWKGKRGTALLCEPSLATFLRAMTRMMGREGKCRIYTLELNQRAIASAVALTCGDHAYFWKTAYDEAFAAASPGVLLTMEVTQRLLDDPQVATTDSCAIPNHPMIDRVWRDKIELADVMVAVASADPVFNQTVYRENVRRRIRGQVKSVLARLRRT